MLVLHHVQHHVHPHDLVVPLLPLSLPEDPIEVAEVAVEVAVAVVEVGVAEDKMR